VTQPVEYTSVGERIAIYRRRRGLSQLALANMIGRSEAWLSQVERGIRHVDRVSVLIRLAQVLKVTVEDLIGQPLSSYWLSRWRAGLRLAVGWAASWSAWRLLGRCARPIRVGGWGGC